MAIKKYDDAATDEVKSESTILSADGDVDVKADLAEKTPEQIMKDGYAEALKFNEEIIEVMVHESADKNASMIVETWVNGVPQRFIRGVPIKCKRKYVEVLARAKNIGITTDAGRKDSGEAYTNIRRTSALMYPFSVLSDENPKGRAWLKSLI